MIIPKDVENQCCGMMFNSRGFKDAAASKGAALQKALLEASEDGKLPIVVDTSPCLSQVCVVCECDCKSCASASVIVIVNLSLSRHAALLAPDR